MSDAPRIPRTRSFMNWPYVISLAVAVVIIVFILALGTFGTKTTTSVDGAVWKARYEEQSKTVVVLNANMSDLRAQVSDLQTQLALQSVDTSPAP